MLSTLLLFCILSATSSHREDPFLTQEVRRWLEEGDDLPGRCQNKDKNVMVGNSAPFIKFGRCEDVPSNCEYIPYGKLDAEGRLEGPSELVIHWTEGDSRDLRVDDVDSDELADIFCYSVSVSLSVRAVRGHFTRGVPQGRVTIEHRNGEETVGNSVDGVLHGVTVTKSREGRILYIGRYFLGRPDGWGWAFSPSDMAEHGVIGFRLDGGLVSWDKVVYLIC